MLMYLKGEVAIFCSVGLTASARLWVGACGGLGNLTLFVSVFKPFEEAT